MTQQSVTTGWRYAALTAAIVAALGIAACSKKDEPAAGAPATSATAAAAPAAAVTTDAELMTKAKTAEGEKRLYAPAGDNAIEYYLALRQRNPKDAIANNALQDLFPYAMIATEQNLKKGDEPGRVEAARIFALLERVDTNAPSLPRLRATMQTVAASELKAQQDEAKKTQDALAKKTADDAKAVAAAAALKGQPPPTQTVAPPPVQTQAAAPPPKQVQQQPVQAPPPRPAQNEAPAQTQQEPPAPKPARAGGALPDVVSSVQPTYPRDALRDGVSGEVTVAFTVNPDGSVSGASVVSSNPRRVFDNAALEAIKKWRFEAPGASVTGRRTFAFSPGQ
jgi:protein TonB